MKKYYKFNGYHTVCENCRADLDTYEENPENNTCEIKYDEENSDIIIFKCNNCWHEQKENETFADFDYE